MQAISETLGANPAFTLIAVVLGLLLVLVISAWLFRKIAGTGSVRANRNRQPRLSVTDAAIVDDKRRLVLVRRDNVEHLVMIGGPNDFVIEHAIVRTHQVAPPPREPAPHEAQEQLPPRQRPRDAAELAQRVRPDAPAALPEAPPARAVNEVMPEAGQREPHRGPAPLTVRTEEQPPAQRRVAAPSERMPPPANREREAMRPAVAELQADNAAPPRTAPQPAEPPAPVLPPVRAERPAAPEMPLAATAAAAAAAAPLAALSSEPELDDIDGDMFEELVRQVAEPDPGMTNAEMDAGLADALELDLSEIVADASPAAPPAIELAPAPAVEPEPVIPEPAAPAVVVEPEPAEQDLETALAAELETEIDFSELLAQSAPVAPEPAPEPVSAAAPRKAKGEDIEDEMQRLLEELANA